MMKRRIPISISISKKSLNNTCELNNKEKTSNILCSICYMENNNKICKKCKNEYTVNEQRIFILVNQVSDVIRF